MAEIVLDGIEKRFPDGTWAVKPTHLTIRDGELFILVGPSGCGKSTLLKMIVGLERPSGGRVRVAGEDVTGRDPKDRNMAMVFQSYALYPHMTVRQNMAFPLKLAGVDRAEIDARVEEAAGILELGGLLERRPAALSGGQRQRVAMGRAIVRQPLAFLLDEPLSNLDAKLRVQMRTELARLQRRLGTTMVYVTHDQTEAMTLGERIAVLRAGEIQQVGAPRELYQRPANLFVAGFIGSPAMNRLPVRVDGGRLVFPMTETGLPERFRGRLAGETRSLIAGVRPEHFVSGSDGEPREGRFEVRVEVIEWLGADVFVHFDVSGGRLEELRGEPDLETGHEGRLRMVARVPGDIRFREGERTDLYLDPRGLLLFDDRTGERIG